MRSWLLSVISVLANSCTVGGGLTEGTARASRAILEDDGSGPAAARVKSVRNIREGRMLIFVGRLEVYEWT